MRLNVFYDPYVYDLLHLCVKLGVQVYNIESHNNLVIFYYNYNFQYNLCDGKTNDSITMLLQIIVLTTEINVMKPITLLHGWH